jgi:ribosomal protein S9
MAFARIIPGSGVVKVNGMDFEEYFFDNMYR